MGIWRVDGHRLYFRSAGRGEPLVLLHGLGSSSEDWEYQIPAFARRGFRVIAPDLRGFGGSARAGDYRVERFSADLDALLDRLGIASFHLLGHSMGGAVAMQYTLDHPGRVRRLVLSNTLPSFRTDTVGKRLLLWSRLLLMGLFGPRRLSERIAQRLYPHPHQSELRRKVAARNARNDRHVYLSTIRALVEWSVLPRLGELTLPVLVLAAEHDYFPLADAQAFGRALPDGRLRVFKGTRHGMPLGIPDAFNEAVLEFFAGRSAIAPRSPALDASAAA